MSLIKKLLLLPAVAVCLNAVGQSVWQQTAQPVGPHFRTVEAIGDTLFAVKADVDFLYRSIDGGKNWKPVPDVGGANRLYKAGKTIVAEAANVYKVSYDRGETWQFTGLTYQFHNFYATGNALYYTDQNSLIDFHAIANGPVLTLDQTEPIVDVAKNGDDMFVLSFGGIWYSPDSGQNWTKTVSSDTVPQFFDSYYSRLTASENHLYVSKPGDGLYRSDDDGATWAFVYPPQGSGINWQVQHLLTTGDTLFYTYINLFASTDYGQTWQIRTALGSEMTGLTEEGANWYVSSTMGIYRSPDRGFTWYAANGLIDAPSAPGVLGVAGNGERLYYNTGLGLFVSPDKGRTFKLALSFGGYLTTPWVIGDTVFYSGLDGLEVSVDGGESFQTMTPPGCSSCIAIEFLGYVHNRLITYKSVTTADNLVFRFSPATLEFEPWPNGGGIYDSHVMHKDILMHYNPNTGLVGRIFWDGSTDWIDPGPVAQWNVYAMFSAGSAAFLVAPNQLFRSLDDGDTWQQIALPQPDTYIYRLIGSGDRIVINTDKGLFFSKDKGNTWEIYNEGLSIDPNQYNALSAAEDIAFFQGTGYLFRRDFDNFFRLKGEVYEDVNNNGVRDGGEPPAHGVLVTSSQAKFALRVDAAGQFSGFPVLEGDTLGVKPVSPYAVIKPAFHTVELSDSVLQFGVHYFPGKRDLTPSVASLTPVRPGFKTDFYLTCQNNGTTSATGEVQLVLPQELTYVSASPLPNTVSPGGDTLRWQLDQIERFENQAIVVSAICDVSVPLGTQLCLSTAITTAGTDANSADNNAENCFTVVGSFDPNDKQSDPVERITPAQVADGTPVVFTVRFQNTGTYPAEFVTILDTLDVNTLHPGTFRVIASSHPMTWTLENKGLVRFLFEDINLPGSLSNEPESHGFVQYSVQPRDGLVLGDAIRNTAYIYFDFNLPVVTNTTETTVTLPNTAGGAGEQLDLALYPNPATAFVRLSGDALRTGGRLEIRDAPGRLWTVQPFAGGRQVEIDVRRLPAGWYTLRVFTEKGTGSIVFGKL